MRHVLRHVLLLLGTAVLTVIAYYAARALWLDAKRSAMGPDPSVAIEGCDVVDTGARSTCHIPARSSGAGPTELTVWIADTDLLPRTVEVTLRTAWRDRGLEHQHNPLWPQGHREGPGTQLVLAVGEGGILELDGMTKVGPWHWPWHWAVEIVERPPTPRYDAIAARWNGGDGVTAEDREALRAELRAIVDGSGGEPWEVTQARALLAELLRHEDPGAAVKAYEDAHARADAGELALRCRLRRNVAELHAIAGSQPNAEATLAQLDAEGCDALGLAHRHRRALVEGLLRLSQERYAEAIARLLEAARGAERMRTRRNQLTAYARLATALGHAQLHESAATALDEAMRTADAHEGLIDCDDRAALLGIAIDLEVHRGGLAGPRLGALRDEVLRSDCPHASVVGMYLRLQLAYAELLLGRLDQADLQLDQALQQLDQHALEHANPEEARQGQRQERLYVASIRGEVAVARGSRPTLVAAQQTLTALLGALPHADDAELVVQRDVFAARLAGGRADLSLARTGAPVAPEDRPGLVEARGLLLAAFLAQDERLRFALLGLSASRLSAKDAEVGRLLVEVQLQLHELDDARCTVRLLRNREARMLADAASVIAGAPHLMDEVRVAEDAYQRSEGSSPHEHEQAAERLADARRALQLAVSQAGPAAGAAYHALCEALPEPAEGEHVLAFHQDPQLRWWIFDWSRGEPARMPLDGGPAELPTEPVEAFARLLAPVRERLASAERVRLLASGATHAIAFEGLPWDEGTTLEQRFIVTWGVDLPRRSAPGGPVQSPTRRVVVCTYAPGGGCESPEFAVLEAVLGRVWGTTVALIYDGATSVREVTKLSKGAFLVLVGESSLSADLGLDAPDCSRSGTAPTNQELDPFDVGLEVGMSLLDAAAMLTLPPPPVAVLESCATGPIDTASLGGAIGLGHMLIVAGSQQVLGTRHKVCLEESYEFVAALVEATAVHGHDLPRLLRAIRTQVDPRYEHRVLVP
jgi:hypothetical protein